MKYARIVDGRTVDVVDLDIYDPRPDWGAHDFDFLDRIFAAVGGHVAFVVVPDDTANGMERKDDGSYGWPEPAPAPAPLPVPDPEP